MTSPFDPIDPSSTGHPELGDGAGGVATLERPVGAGTGGVEVASLGRRALAYLLDGLSLAAVTIVVAILVLIVGAAASGGSFSFDVTADEYSSAGDLVAFAATFAALLAVPLLYWTVVPARPGLWRGRSVGKRTLDLQVISVDGTAVTPRQARRRGLVFVGPAFAAVIVGPLLDAAAGTPPLFTFLLLGGSYVFTLADIVVAPLRGELRRSIHDRVAGTVVVDARTAPAFAPTHEGDGDASAALRTPPIARPRSGSTWLYGGAGALLIVLAITGLALGSFGSTTSMEKVPASDLALGASPGQADTQRLAARLAVQYVTCWRRHGEDAGPCRTDEALGLPAGTISTTTDSALDYGQPALAGRIAVTTHPAFGEEETPGSAIGAYDAEGTFWGFLLDDEGTLSPVCQDTNNLCADKDGNPQGHTFRHDRELVQSIVDSAGR